MIDRQAILAAALAASSLIGCAGEGDRGMAFVQDGAQAGEGTSAVVSSGQGSSTAPDDLLPLLRTGGGDFQIVGLAAPRAEDAEHMPIYHDGKHLFVGVDQGTAQIGFLRQRYREDGI